MSNRHRDFIDTQTSLPSSTSQPRDRNPTRAHGFVGDSKWIDPKQVARKFAEFIKGVVTTPDLNFYTAPVFVSAKVQIVRGANKNRKYLALQNNGTVDIFLSFGASADINTSHTLPPDGVWTFESGYVPNNEFSAVATTGALLTVTEGVLGE